jgi:hypothetical protein
VLNRRAFVLAAARGLLAAPLATLAQQAANIDRRDCEAARRGPMAACNRQGARARRVVDAGPEIASAIPVNFPPGGQMHGAMIFPHHSKGLGAEQIEWNANFRLQHFTDRLDYLKAMGANCAKILGEVWYVHHGRVTLAEYCEQWDQVMAYAKSIGLYVYVCPFTPLTQWDVPLESLIRIVSGLIAHIEAQSYADYITCYDIAEEARTFGFQAESVGAIYNACRRRTSRAMCVSWSGTAANYDSELARFLPYCDFIDIHTYGITPVALPPDAYRILNTNHPSHDVIIGEWGNNETYSDLERAQRTATFFAAVHGAKVKGTFLWCLDSSARHSDPTNCWGIYHGLPEDLVVPPFSAYHDYMQAWRRGVSQKAGMAAPSAPRINGRRITWDSPNATDYKADRLYRNGVKVFEDVFALYDGWSGEPTTTWQAATVDRANIERRGPAITTEGMRSGAPELPVFTG